MYICDIGTYLYVLLNEQQILINSIIFLVVKNVRKY